MPIDTKHNQTDTSASSKSKPWWMDPAEYGDEASIDTASVYLDDDNVGAARPASLLEPSQPTRKNSKSTKQQQQQLQQGEKPSSHRRQDNETTSSSKPSSSRSSKSSSKNQRDGRSQSKSSEPLPRNISATASAALKQWKSTIQTSLTKAGETIRKITPPAAAASKRSASVDSEAEGRTSSQQSSFESNNSNNNDYRKLSVSELIQSLGQDDVDLPPTLERRVRDFKFAQGKRKERHGEKKPWGIFGLYAHLSDIRADLEWAEDAAWRRQRNEPYLSWSDFEKSRDKGLHNRPWFTYGVLFLCTIMMLVTFGANNWKIEPLSVNLLIGPSSETLVNTGARESNLIVNEGQWFRLFSPLVLHAGLIHYVINMGALYLIGAAVEQSHGFASAAVLFIIPAVGGNILSAICLPQYISVGASGGIFGLIGGCVADICINWNLLFLKSTTDDDQRWRHGMVLFWLFADALLNCFLGFTPFVDNFTHLGGFLYGLACGLSTLERLGVGFFGLETSKWSKWSQTVMRFMGLILSVVSIMVTTIVLVQSDGLTSPCHGCRFISCIPFPPNANEKWWYCDDCDFVTAELYIASDGTNLYEEVELTCPSGEIADVTIGQDGFTEREDVRRALPKYCRQYCADVFINTRDD